MSDKSKGKSLEERLINLSFIVIFLSLLVVEVIFTWYSKEQAYKSLVDDLQVLGQVIGQRSAASLVFRDDRTAGKNLASTSLNKSVTKACLYDQSGQLFANYTTDRLYYICEAENHNFINRVSQTEGIVSVQTRVMDSGETLGLISVSATTKDIKESLYQAASTILFTFVFMSAFAYLLLKRWIARTLAPLNHLRATASSIAENPFSGKRAEKIEDDEVGQLVSVFNHMLEKLDQENEALTLSETRFRSLAENSPVGIYQVDEQGQFTYVNDTWQQLTGLFKGVKSEDYAKLVSDQERDLYFRVLQEVRQKGQAKVIEYRYSAPQKKGDAIFMEYIAPLHKDMEGRSGFTGYIGSLLDISDLKDAQMELENLAFYDSLTNLPNRRFFKDHLRYVVAGAINTSTRLAMLMLDLDNFKKVNDTLGHDAGDELLVILAARLKSLVSKKDVVSRMGGDEFMIMLSDIDVRSSIRNVADRILRGLEAPVNIKGHELSISASIGVATFPEDAETEDGLIRCADLALYLSKDSGRNRMSFFSSQLQDAVNAKVVMEARIREALINNEFTFYIQPKWDLEQAQLCSGEILIRWWDAEGNFVPPDEFIPLAEENGQILEVGDWLLEAVAASIERCKEQLKALNINSIAINLSARQLFDNLLLSKVESVFARHNIDPSYIEFELTESAVMEDIERAIDVMNGLKALGCQLSIDDFGTGYSSLAYLKRFPIDAVKIDRSFISDIPQDQNDVEISSAIIAMGHSLGMEVVAEGVETAEQIEFLVNKQCDYAQGYFISKPIPFDELFLRASQINTNMTEQIAEQSKPFSA